MVKKYIKFITLLFAFTLMLSPASSFANELTYKEIIAPKYEDAYVFSEGLAAVKKNGKWGYVNENDEVIIDFKYSFVNSFKEGKAIVARDDDTSKDMNICWGFVDKKASLRTSSLNIGVASCAKNSTQSNTNILSIIIQLCGIKVVHSITAMQSSTFTTHLVTTCLMQMEKKYLSTCIQYILLLKAYWQRMLMNHSTTT